MGLRLDGHKPPFPSALLPRLIFLLQKKYHELFVSSGGLGVLKAWLEPYSDGSLPNTRVRTAILKACKVRTGPQQQIWGRVKCKA